MMVDRGHFKQALTVGNLKVSNLQDHGQGLHDIHKAYQDQDQRYIQRKGKAADHTAQKQAAGIAHKHFCRMKIPY